MVIYLDYIRSQALDDIVFLSLFDESGSQYDFTNDNLDDVEDFLSQEINTIVYERPIMHLVPHMDEEDMKEYEIRKHYFDLFRFMQEQTGFKISLSGLARGMLGTGPQSDISRLPTAEVTVVDFEVRNKVHERLRTIRDVYEALKTTGFATYYFKRVLHSQEVDVSELES